MRTLDREILEYSNYVTGLAQLNTVVIRVDGDEPSLRAISQGAELLRAGKLVAFPTETVYGLGANALDAEAVARIFAAKGRPSYNPVIVHVPDVAGARALAAAWTEAADRLARAFWPGPLTIVLPKSDQVPEIVTAWAPTVGLRVPAHPVALALLTAAGVPVAAPSANRSTQLSPTTAEHVVQSLNGRIEMIIDGGPTTGGIESTVVSLAGNRPRLLRPGLITPSQIELVIGPILRPPHAEDANIATAALSEVNGRTPRALPSPGMLARHYAPRARLEVAADAEARVRQLLAEGRKVGWLRWPYALLTSRPGGQLMIVAMPDSPDGYASKLYAALHMLDDSGVDRIVVDALPAADEWLALRDRLNRASAQE